MTEQLSLSYRFYIVIIIGLLNSPLICDFYLKYFKFTFRNALFWTVLLNCDVGEDSCESLGLQWDPTSPKGDQSWVFTGGTGVEAETPILWPPDAESWLIWKDPDAGKDWGQEKGTTEDEMVGWHHWHNGHGFGWTPGVGNGQGGLACCGSWGPKKLDTTELKWTECTFYHQNLKVCMHISMN